MDLTKEHNHATRHHRPRPRPRPRLPSDAAVLGELDGPLREQGLPSHTPPYSPDSRRRSRRSTPTRPPQGRPAGGPQESAGHHVPTVRLCCNSVSGWWSLASAILRTCFCLTSAGVRHSPERRSPLAPQPLLGKSGFPEEAPQGHRFGLNRPTVIIDCKNKSPSPAGNQPKRICRRIRVRCSVSRSGGIEASGSVRAI